MSRKVGDSAELVATTSSKAGARSWDQDATHGCLNVYVSMTVQSIFGMDKSKMTCDMFIELDFKYDAGAYCKAFGSSPGITGDAATSAKDALIQAEALKMPWLILNALSVKEMRTNHFFRVKSSPDDPGAESMSIYRTPENVAPEATLDQIQRGLVVKYEKHSMCATLRYLSHTELDPFDEIYAFIKVATDGRPGTEKTKLIFDLKDNSFDGLKSSLGEYTPAGETEHLDFRRSLPEGAYPRIYVFQRFEHRWFESFLEFYFTSYLLNILMCLVYAGYEDDAQAGMLIDASGNNLTAWWTPTSAFVDTNSAVSVSATFILADVALLFVAGGSSRTMGASFTLSEKVVVHNLVLQLFLAVWICKGYLLGIPVWFTTTLSIVVPTALNLALWTRQYRNAGLKNARVGTLIRQLDFKALNGL